MAEKYNYIKYDGDSYLDENKEILEWLIHKHNASEITDRSKITVSPGQVAILVHNGKIEKILSNGTTEIKSELLPGIVQIQKKGFKGANTFPIEIYFINTRLKLDFLWGTSSPIELRDPIYGIILHLMARGQMAFEIKDYQYLFDTLIGTFSNNSTIYFSYVSNFFKGVVNQKIRGIIGTTIFDKKIPYDRLNLYINEIQDKLKETILDAVKKFGMNIVDLNIETIEAWDEDVNMVNDILKQRAHLDIMGENNYRLQRGYDILEKGASNEGGAVGTFMGVGMAQNFNANINNQNRGIIPSTNNSSEQNTDFVSCIHCSAKIKKSIKFCSECGQKQQLTCTQCKANIPVNTKFCPECGKDQINE
ncbi:SPFH domain-containing protein [Mycoplasma zalophi]|uniref:SPFH domain-containing protein n=1 Tax=Mycoplasma zalophi TaxID=191287 RepID=UPI0021C89501|nr:SPFH domain-containing protein [Mycoplasma zalophi]MCU4117024.1 SPFH domain-containing protein [Mycoplasma zalophi]